MTKNPGRKERRRQDHAYRIQLGRKRAKLHECLQKKQAHAK